VGPRPSSRGGGAHDRRVDVDDTDTAPHANTTPRTTTKKQPDREEHLGDAAPLRRAHTVQRHHRLPSPPQTPPL
jgi:hypothetical protein